jgi:hypothetical protein
MNSNALGIVYLLTNPAMTGLVKIGMTLKTDVESRMRELYSTGVPLPFKCEYACSVNAERCAEIEKAFHTAFSPYRINANREFFRIEPEQAIALMKLLDQSDCDVTFEFGSEMQSLLDSNDKVAVENERKRRPNLNFREMGIPVGSQLEYIIDASIKCEVIGDHKVKYDNQETSLSALTNQLLGKCDGYGVIPTRHWSYNGRIIYEIYNETYK